MKLILNQIKWLFKCHSVWNQSHTVNTVNTEDTVAVNTVNTVAVNTVAVNTVAVNTEDTVK